jgi:hypothetical protein
MPKVTLQARMPGEKKWKTRNTFGHSEDALSQALRMIEMWRGNYHDGAELRVHVGK